MGEEGVRGEVEEGVGEGVGVGGATTRGRDWLPCQIKIRPLFHHLIPVNLLRRELGHLGGRRRRRGFTAGTSALICPVEAANLCQSEHLCLDYKAGLR